MKALLQLMSQQQQAKYSVEGKLTATVHLVSS